MALLALLAATPALWILACRDGDAAAPKSVLLVVVDTLRPDHLGLYGHDRPTTPSLDRRAARAVVYEHAFSTSSWTLPAVASILTGRLPSSHGARSLTRGPLAQQSLGESIERRAKSFAPLDPAVPTFAELLAAAGFSTGAITSNPFLDPRFGLDRGFASYDQVPRRKANAVTDAALAWLDRHRDEPFFLFVHLMDPHLPYRPPAELRGRFTGGIDSRLGYSAAGVRTIRKALPGLPASDRAFLEAAYDEEIVFVDQQLERLLSGLEKMEIWDSTLVMLTSDHGEELFEHGGFEHGHSLYDEVLRVPLAVWDPRAEPGRRTAPVSLADLLPTALEALGRETPGRMEGVSFWPSLIHEASTGRRLIAAQDILHGDEQQAVIDWPRKLIYRPDGGALQLFDLAADPAEGRDLAADDPAAAAALLRSAKLLLQPKPDGAESLELDSATIEELRALGYIQ